MSGIENMGDLKEAVEEVQAAAGAADPNDDPDFQLTQGKRRFPVGRRWFGDKIQISKAVSRRHRNSPPFLSLFVLSGAASGSEATLPRPTPDGPLRESRDVRHYVCLPDISSCCNRASASAPRTGWGTGWSSCCTAGIYGPRSLSRSRIPTRGALSL